MVDIASIAGLASSLKAAGDITKAMIDLRDAAAVQTKVIELQRVILSAQSSALAAQQDQMTMLEHVRQLEAEVARFKTWDAEKQKYQLQSVFTGAFAYVLKEEAKGTQPPHWLCANCYDNGKKSVLQAHGRDPHDRSYEMYACTQCRGHLRVHYTIRPGAEHSA